MYGNFIVSYDSNHKHIYTDDRQLKLLTWPQDHKVITYFKTKEKKYILLHFREQISL